jgi:hypothetical protein
MKQPHRAAYPGRFSDDLPCPIVLVRQHQRRDRIKPECLIDLKTGTLMTGLFAEIIFQMPGEIGHINTVIADNLAFSLQYTSVGRHFVFRLFHQKPTQSAFL